MRNNRIHKRSKNKRKRILEMKKQGRKQKKINAMDIALEK